MAAFSVLRRMCHPFTPVQFAGGPPGNVLIGSSQSGRDMRWMAMGSVRKVLEMAQFFPLSTSSSVSSWSSARCEGKEAFCNSAINKQEERNGGILLRGDSAFLLLHSITR